MALCTYHPTSDGSARWPCGHHSCVECAKKLITWSTICPECRKPHNGAYTIDLTDDLSPSLPKNVPPAASSSTAPAAKPKARGKSTTTPKQPKKAAAKPRAKSSTSLGSQIMALESEVETLRAREAAQASEIASMRLRLSQTDNLRTALEARAVSLIQETTDIKRERDVALTGKSDAEKRLKQIEDDRLGQEVRWIRRVKGEEQKGKRLQEQLDATEKRANQLQEILAHHKNKETEHREIIRKLKFENLRLQRVPYRTASSPPPTSPTVRHISSMPSSSPMVSQASSSPMPDILPSSSLPRRSRMPPPLSSSPAPPSSPLPSSSPPRFSQNDKLEIVGSSRPSKRRRMTSVSSSDLKHASGDDNGKSEASNLSQPSNKTPSSSEHGLDKSMFLPSSAPINVPSLKKPKTDGTLASWITNSPTLHIGPRHSRKV